LVLKLVLNKDLKLKQLDIMKHNLMISLLLSIIFSVGCNKYVEVNKLTDRLLESEVFNDISTANSSILGLYQQLRQLSMVDNIVIDNSTISGDIYPYGLTSSHAYYTNNLHANDSSLPWSKFYRTIYMCNRAVEGIQHSNNLSLSKIDEFLGEALFVRAFSHFMLVNFYGDIPLVLTSNVEENRLIARSPNNIVYQEIINDLKRSQSLLEKSISNTYKGRANFWSATALLARAYLYQENYVQAEIESNKIIQSGRFELLSPGGRVFQVNSKEAIWQWFNNTTQSNSPASRFLYTSSPGSVCTDFLVNAFEEGDVRKEKWLKTSEFAGSSIFVPLKFTSAAAGTDESYTAIRLAEIYLIRAEALMMQGKYEEGIADINTVRKHHGGLEIPLPAPTDKESAITIVLQERRVELFTEGAHRWFDLKRTGRLDATMAIEKPTTWNSWAALYPILQSDIQQNPNLKQNPGYE
jgi:tetratricopeptide (TPR) repeat protein